MLDEIISTDEFNGFGDLKTWLRGIPCNPVRSDVRGEKVLQLCRYFEIEERGQGVSRNDMSLVAYAWKHQFVVVTEESKQTSPPNSRSKYKIPLVCEKLGVRCLNWAEFLRYRHVFSWDAEFWLS